MWYVGLLVTHPPLVFLPENFSYTEYVLHTVLSSSSPDPIMSFQETPSKLLCLLSSILNVFISVTVNLLCTERDNKIIASYSLVLSIQIFFCIF